MEEDKLRQELLNYLGHVHAHAPLSKAVANFPIEMINKKPEGVPYTFFGLLEHIRTSQKDMIDFIVNPEYKEPNWPKDFWPDPDFKATLEMWEESVNNYEKDLEDFKSIIEDSKTDLFAKIPHGTGQTIFKEALQIIDHAAYHIGEFVLMRRVIGIW